MQPLILKHSQFNCRDRVYDMIKQGRYLYVANGGSGFKAIDNNTGRPVIGTSSLHVIDFIDSRNPVTVNQTPTVGRPRAICASGKYVFVAEEYAQETGIMGGLVEVFDVSNPSRPFQVGSNPTPSFAYDIAYQNGIVYVADEQSGLHVFRVDSYGRLDNIAICRGFGNAKRLHINGDKVYMVDREIGLLIYSVTDPGNPVLIGTCNIPRDNFGVCLHKGRALVANRYNGIYFVNIDDPKAPFVEQIVNTRESNIDVVSDNLTIFVASMDPNVPGIQAFVQESNNSLRLVYDIDTNGNVWALTLSDGLLIGANGDFGLISLNISY